jgi:hypothetical protein
MPPSVPGEVLRTQRIPLEAIARLVAPSGGDPSDLKPAAETLAR